MKGRNKHVKRVVTEEITELELLTDSGDRDYYVKEIRSILQELIYKCEGEFEKKVIYIASGALGLSFAFISDIVDLDASIFLAFLMIGWVLLVICVCLNLYSQLISKRYASKTIDDIDKENNENIFNSTEIRKLMIKRNWCTNIINHSTTWIMLLGITFILAFAFINIWQSIANTDAKQHHTHSTLESSNHPPTYRYENYNENK